MIRVGTAGIPQTAKGKGSKKAVKVVSDLGLNAMEIEYVYGVRMKDKTAEEIGKEAEKHEVSLSAHAPYYVNLNSKEEDKIKASEERVMKTARKTDKLGGNRVTFHPGYYSGKEPEEAMEVFKKEFKKIQEKIEKEKLDVTLSPETTGKIKQFGDWDELMEAIKEIPEIGMTLDFAHVWAREKGNIEFDKVFQTLEQELGSEFFEDMHMHFSGIQWNKGGEDSHLILEESDFPLQEMLEVIESYEVQGTMICESPNLEEDALKVKKMLEERGVI